MENKELIEKCLVEINKGMNLAQWEVSATLLRAPLETAIPIIQKEGFDEGVKKATDACNSTFVAQLKGAKKKAVWETLKMVVKKAEDELYPTNTGSVGTRVSLFIKALNQLAGEK